MSFESPQIKAVIYDVDGTMVDSEPLHVQAWGEALRKYNRYLEELSENFRATMAGKKPIVIAQGMVEELNLPIVGEELFKVKTDLFMELVRASLKGMPGAAESIRRLHDRAYLLAIGTALDRGYIKIVLERLGVADYFKIVVTGDQIKHGKPHPETYLAVTQQLGLDPNQCLVLEDAKSGIASAKAAGCYCIAIKNPNALPQDTSQADKTVASLEAVTPDFIEALTQ